MRKEVDSSMFITVFVQTIFIALIIALENRIINSIYQIITLLDPVVYKNEKTSVSSHPFSLNQGLS